MWQRRPHRKWVLILSGKCWPLTVTWSLTGPKACYFIREAIIRTIRGPLYQSSWVERTNIFLQNFQNPCDLIMKQTEHPAFISGTRRWARLLSCNCARHVVFTFTPTALRFMALDSNMAFSWGLTFGGGCGSSWVINRRQSGTQHVLILMVFSVQVEKATHFSNIYGSSLVMLKYFITKLRVCDALSFQSNHYKL